MSHNVSPAPSSSPRDARAARSALALEGALLTLLARKPLEQITVREVAAEAGVSYATFFRHHPTKEALLAHVAEDQIDRLVALSLPMLAGTDGTASVEATCAFVADHRTLWVALLTGGAAASMRASLIALSRPIAAAHPPVNDWLPTELGVTCSVNIIFDVLAWWLGQPDGSVDIEQIAAIMHRLLTDANLIGGDGRVADRPATSRSRR